MTFTIKRRANGELKVTEGKPDEEHERLVIHHVDRDFSMFADGLDRVISRMGYEPIGEPLETTYFRWARAKVAGERVL